MIASLTTSSTARSTSGCCDISLYLVTSSASVRAAPCKSMYVPYAPPAATTTAPSSVTSGANVGCCFCSTSGSTLRRISNPNRFAITTPLKKRATDVAHPLLGATGCASDTATHFPPVILEGNLKLFNRICIGPVQIN